MGLGVVLFRDKVRVTFNLYLAFGLGLSLWLR